jgi:hypothetical protein
MATGHGVDMVKTHWDGHAPERHILFREVYYARMSLDIFLWDRADFRLHRLALHDPPPFGLARIPRWSLPGRHRPDHPL